MRLRRYALGAVALGLLLVGFTATPAAAHASLVSVDPADGARLDESPDHVTLVFTEHVSADLGGVRVLDSDGRDVQVGAARVSGGELQVDLQPDLPEGTYVISYRVVSADGHPVRGGSVFGVGDVTVDSGALGRVGSTDGDRVWDVVGAIGRGLAYAGILLAAGGTAFLVLVHRDPDAPERMRLPSVVRRAAIVGGVAALVALPVQAALGTGQGPGSLLDDGVLGEVLRDGVGPGLAAALVGLVLLVVAGDRAPVVALTGAVLAAASFAASGHTRAGGTATLATLADITHLLAVAAWGGGLVFLWLALKLRHRSGSADPTATVGLVTRFSSLATVTVLLVGATGLALAWSEVRSLSGLLDTTYGRLVLTKAAVVLVIAGLSAYNHFRLVPALAQGKATAALAQLRATLRVEALALTVVLALTAVLVVTTPARTLAEGGVVEDVTELADVGTVQVTVSPAQAGVNTIHLYLFDPSGRPADIAETITLELSLGAADLGPIERDALRAGPAHFQLDGDDLAVGGTWTITVRARVDRFTEATGTVEIPVAG